MTNNEFDAIKDKINKYSKLLPIGMSLSPVENERRAAEFLVAQAYITEWRHILGEDKIKFLSTQTAVYAVELAKGEAKTMTENKVTAEASKSFIEAREALEVVENNLNYLRIYQDIFGNAHVFYRQLAKENNSL